MTDAGHLQDPHTTATTDWDPNEHPRGTLALVVALGLFFALGWLAMYVFLFLERGAPHS